MELGPRLVFWEVTQRCNLACPYCRRNGYSGNLSLKESLRIVDSIAADYRPILVFSGGEPLLHPNIFEIASHAVKEGLMIALATNGTLIDELMAKRIEEAGFHRVAVSLDGSNSDINDSMRGQGAFLKTMSGIQHLKAEGVDLQVNTTVTKRNVLDIPNIYKLCLGLQVKALHIFAFVPVGCGMAIPKDERLSDEEYEEFLNYAVDLYLESKMEIKVTCGPHYYRILSERLDNKNSIALKGCLAGSGVCFISARGEIYPCGYLKISAGNMLNTAFKEIWMNSNLFHTLRSTNYLKGRCGDCEYVDICGGCRARAYAKTGDYLEEEPDCSYLPLTVKS